MAPQDAALRAGLAKTRGSLLGRLGQLLTGGAKVDPKLLDELEEALLTADVGVGLTMSLLEQLRADAKSGKLDSAEAVRDALKRRMAEALTKAKPPPGRQDGLAAPAGASPYVILFVGVNGVGKTTTIGKVAAKFRARGQSVVLAAGDTFRAAAAQQLGIWAERTGATLVRGEEGADPASVVWTAIEQAKKAGADVVLADTAGRLHTKTELMDEVKKVQRSLGKARAGAPDETWLVVDGTTGQNALQQAREFHQALGLTGIVLTKLDGTAKGGVVVAIAEGLGVPIRFVGVGETAEDLRPFDAASFVEALLGEG